MGRGNKGGVDFFSSAAQTAAWGRLVGRHIGSRNGPEHCKIVHLNGEVPSGSGYKGPIPHPLPSASKCVLLRGRVCGASSQAGLLFLRLGRYLGVVVLGNLGNLVLHSGIFGIVPVHAGQSVHCAGQRRKVCRAYFLWSLVLFGELGFITHNRLRLSLHSSSLVRSTRR